MKKIRFNSAPVKAAALLALLLSVGRANAQCSAGFNYTVGAAGSAQFQSTSVFVTPTVPHLWNYGDGNSDMNAGTANHTYAAQGDYPVTLSIMDKDGECFSAITQTVSITNAPCLAPVSFFMEHDSLQPLIWSAIPNYHPNTTAVSWSWGDGSTTTGMYPTHTYSTAGTYSICVSVTVACGASATFCLPVGVYRTSENMQMYTVNVIQRNTTPTGIQRNSTSELKTQLYPNPSPGNTTLGLYVEQAGSYRLQVMSTDGQLLLQDQLNATPGDNTLELNTAGLQRGLYLVTISSASGRKTMKLIKE